MAEIICLGTMLIVAGTLGLMYSESERFCREFEEHQQWSEQFHLDASSSGS